MVSLATLTAFTPHPTVTGSHQHYVTAARPPPLKRFTCTNRAISSNMNTTTTTQTPPLSSIMCAYPKTLNASNLTLVETTSDGTERTHLYARHSRGQRRNRYFKQIRKGVRILREKRSGNGRAGCGNPMVACWTVSLGHSITPRQNQLITKTKYALP